MGWGDPPHEGYTARRLTVQAAAHNQYPEQGDTRWTSAYSYDTRETEGWQSRCSCGWHSDRFHLNDDPERASEPDDVGQRIWAEWRDTHMAPLVDPHPDDMLVLAADAGGSRHFLAGHAVHAGATLELRLADDRWVPVRYEWGWDSRRPRAYLALGGRGESVGQSWTPEPVSFEIPEGAELRWPIEDGRAGDSDTRSVLRGVRQGFRTEHLRDDGCPGARSVRASR